MSQNHPNQVQKPQIFEQQQNNRELFRDSLNKCLRCARVKEHLNAIEHNSWAVLFILSTWKGAKRSDETLQLESFFENHARRFFVMSFWSQMLLSYILQRKSSLFADTSWATREKLFQSGLERHYYTLFWTVWFRQLVYII